MKTPRPLINLVYLPAMQLREELLVALKEASSAAALQAQESSNLSSSHDTSARDKETEGEASKASPRWRNAEHGASSPVFDKDRNSKMTKRNPGIHPRNMYATEEPNFAALAAKDCKLRPYIYLDDNQRGYIDFTDSDACRSTYSLICQIIPITTALQKNSGLLERPLR